MRSRLLRHAGVPRRRSGRTARARRREGLRTRPRPGPGPQDDRIVRVSFDLLDPASIAAAARSAADATLLINNASTAAFAGPLDATIDGVQQEMAANFSGTYATIGAYVPVLEANGDGRIVNVLSLLALASTAPMAGYSASKAAAHSLTQALGPALAPRGIAVHGVYPGGIDTDMLAGIDAPKTAPAQVASAILDALAEDVEDIFPRPERTSDVEGLVERPEVVRAGLLRDGRRVNVASPGSSARSPKKACRASSMRSARRASLSEWESTTSPTGR